MSKWMLSTEDYKGIKCPQRSCKTCAENKYGVDYCGYEVEVAKRAQKKLLEYLIAEAHNIYDHNLYPIISKVQLESMLEELK